MEDDVFHATLSKGRSTMLRTKNESGHVGTVA